MLTPPTACANSPGFKTSTLPVASKSQALPIQLHPTLAGPGTQRTPNPLLSVARVLLAPPNVMGFTVTFPAPRLMCLSPSSDC